MKDKIIYPIIVAILLALYAMFINVFGYDYLTVLRSSVFWSFENITIWGALVVISCFITYDIVRRRLKGKITDLNDKLVKLQGYQEELARRVKEDPELERFRAIHRHRMDEKKDT